MIGNYPPTKETIVGGGIVGALEAYFAYLEAKKRGGQVRITIHEKNHSIADTTSSNISPSLTFDEIISVVPPGPVLAEKLEIPFSSPGGIRVDDVDGVNQSQVALAFIKQVQEYSKDQEGHQRRTKLLLEMGKFSMDLWQSIYDEGCPKLKNILEASNFNPCREPKNDKVIALHDGYRIDLIYDVPNARAKALNMKHDYESLGSANCKLLSPKEVKEIDPYLSDFCDHHVQQSSSGDVEWKQDTAAIFRPGGCIDIETFLPKFYAYLKEEMGHYTNSEGKRKDCFQLRLDRNVTGVEYDPNQPKPTINGLTFAHQHVKQNKDHKHHYEHSQYVFCPGGNVGTLTKLDLSEPSFAGFAGASLKLNIPLPLHLVEKFAKLNHCMEVHQEGVVLAWQARVRNDEILIGVAGTKAFYADKEPHKEEAFAKNRNLLQLNMINDVLPECISLALGRNTKGQKLSSQDLQFLEEKNIAKRWVGIRAVACDGFPTLGAIFHADSSIANARTTKDLSSGGVSFGPAAVLFSRSLNGNKPYFNLKPQEDNLRQEVLRCAQSNRKF